jgi:hypothetical protein
VKLHPQLLELERLELQRGIGEIALGAALAHHSPQADHQLAQAARVFRECGGFINHINILP